MSAATAIMILNDQQGGNNPLFPPNVKFLKWISQKQKVQPKKKEKNEY